MYINVKIDPEQCLLMQLFIYSVYLPLTMDNYIYSIKFVSSFLQVFLRNMIRADRTDQSMCHVFVT